MRMARLGFKEEEDMIIDIISSRLLTGYEIIAELEIKGMNFGYSNEREGHIQQFLTEVVSSRLLRLDPIANILSSAKLVENTYCLTLGKLRQHNLDRLIE